MKTTFSVCSLCLLLCVAGSYAATIGGRAGSQPGSSRTLNNMATNDPAYDTAISEVTAAIKNAYQVFIDKDRPNLSASLLKNDIQRSFANFINANINSGYRLAPRGNCELDQIDAEGVSRPFAQAVRQAFKQYDDKYINLSRQCLSKRVREVALETIPLVNKKRCVPEGLAFYFSDFTLEDNGFGGKIYYTVENVFMGMIEKDETKAKDCYSTDVIL